MGSAKAHPPEEPDAPEDVAAALEDEDEDWDALPPLDAVDEDEAPDPPELEVLPLLAAPLVAPDDVAADCPDDVAPEELPAPDDDDEEDDAPAPSPVHPRTDVNTMAAYAHNPPHIHELLIMPIRHRAACWWPRGARLAWAAAQGEHGRRPLCCDTSSPTRLPPGVGF